jgi:hypothetical protein
MNIEEPVFKIIHNYRRPETRNPLLPAAAVENDSDQLEMAEPPSTDATLQSENGQEVNDEDRNE